MCQYANVPIDLLKKKFKQNEWMAFLAPSSIQEASSYIRRLPKLAHWHIGTLAHHC